ncbi:MAG: L-seryl-tRNA(Sec) selenium transferase [Comamonas sp. SCN 67-35]|uniref:L-seryl-tRNA(Sec) selenium transferase n=1 Tax=unclassified Comamonas TaxID=2638500 RepID=UPI0008688762|nr:MULTISPECIES: L-seryl-tRNA(Sec) selenium transferase [unclassified Comamonas]MBN9328806.1 L-seryl-tRNA(Sec) selenium transferase [Comamonas sp.]ODU38524.1 MAG: L-seryl-tRNA(Sec) selenium transferase [Comamonas sp. SCN 67-35]OJX02056.1 MAG: L-seryl-tRNA(Sec) selenium transferase [Burkholderiales bacterium 66-26]
MLLPEESVVHGSSAEPQPSNAARPQDLPALDRLLRLSAVQALALAHGHTLVAQTARALLTELRARAIAGGLSVDALAHDALADALARRVHERLAPRMRTVLNLTGTVLHTNLGRALLPEAAIAHITAMMAAPNDLEFDLVTGRRGDRDSIVEGLLCELTGAEAATVVNNNAAAVLLTLAALASGREVIVSRGELVEIGGAFRMPDVMQSVGARLVEVGTTNRTHPRDYEGAIGERTALLMKVHTSNYQVQGFTSAVAEAQLAPIAAVRGLPLVTDLGSGALIDLGAYGLPPEPTPRQMLADGCALVTFSGDKLLGGPQAGLIVGRKDLVARIKAHPMKRALRMSKLPLAALEATLRLYLRPERLTQDLPTLRLLTRPLAAIEATARAVAPALQVALAPRYSVQQVALQGQIGSGSLPVERLPSSGLALAPVDAAGTGRALEALCAALRALPMPVIGRIHEDRLLLDMRCLEKPAQLLDQIGLLRWSDKRK